MRIRVVVGLVLLLPCSLLAQWDNVAPNLLGPSGTLASYGAIHYCDGVLYAGISDLWASYNLGTTWRKCNFINFGIIKDISFWNRTQGLVATDKGLYETFDGGSTWRPVYTGNTSCAAYGRSTGKAYTSKADAVCHLPCALLAAGPSAKKRVPLTYLDDQYFAGSPIVSSGGSAGTFWGLASSKCGPLLVFATHEWGDPRDNSTSSHVYRSSDGGLTWTVAAVGSPRYTNGSIATSPSAVFAHTWTMGVIRSTDGGQNWISIGGPSGASMWHTRRLCAVDDNLIFCVDASGSIWRTKNSGGNPIVSAPETSLLACLPNTTMGIICSDTQFVTDLPIHNRGCGGDFVLTGIESRSGTLNTSLLCSTVKLPDTIRTGYTRGYCLEFTSPPHTPKGKLIEVWAVGHPVNNPDTTMSFLVAPYVFVTTNSKLPKMSIPLFETISSCIRDTGSLRIDHYPCAGPFTIEAIDVGGGIQPKIQIPISFPFIVNEASTIDLPIVFAPVGEAGSFNGYLVVRGYVGTGEDTIRIEQLMNITATSTFKESLALAPAQIDFGSMSTCEAFRKAESMIDNKTCDTIIVMQPVAVSAPFVLDQTNFPLAIPPGGSASLSVRVLATTVGQHSAKIQFDVSKRGIVETKSLDLTVRVITGSPQFISSAVQYQYPALNLCSGYSDTTIYCTNKGCDTLVITDGPGSLPPEFKFITATSFPRELPPDSTIAYTFRFQPSMAGSYRADPHFSVEQNGETRQLDLTLEGKAFSGDATLAFTSDHEFYFEPLSICNHDSAYGSYTNTGCDTLFFNTPTYAGDPDFTIIGVEKPFLASGDTLKYVVYLDPTEKGMRHGHMTLQTRDRSGVTHDTLITVEAFVADGSRILEASRSRIDLDTTDLCTEGSATVVLTNTGCDTLSVDKAAIAGTGFVISSGITFPIVLAPGESREIIIETSIDTTGGATTNTAFVTFASNSDIVLPAIECKRSFTYPREYDIELTMPVTEGTSSTVATLMVAAGESWKQSGHMTGVQKLAFDLDMSSDLLEYTSVISAENIVQVNGKHVTIEGKPDIAATSGVVAELRYTVHLTVDTATAVTLSNLVVNNGSTAGCAPKASAAGKPSFTYLFQCGERSIRKFLKENGIGLGIISIRPNPATSVLTVELRVFGSEPVKLAVYNDRGELVVEYDQVRSLYDLPIDKLSEGSYTVEARQAGSSASARFVVVK